LEKVQKEKGTIPAEGTCCGYPAEVEGGYKVTGAIEVRR